MIFVTFGFLYLFSFLVFSGTAKSLTEFPLEHEIAYLSRQSLKPCQWLMIVVLVFDKISVTNLSKDTFS